MSRPPTESLVVVGGGVTGLTAALAALDHGVARVRVVETDARPGGKIRSSTFAGLDGIDEGPDAFLTRVPDAVALCRDLGLDASFVHPTAATAAVWYPTGGIRRRGPLHPIPGGTVLGVPAEVLPFARSGLLTWRGKARAALEPILPRTSVDHDELGTYVRRRVGGEVHERLVDALVGSIYASDTDRASLRSIPQLAGLAASERSLLLGARRARRRMLATSGPSDPTAPPAPIFAAPRDGMGALVRSLVHAVVERGGEVVTGTRVVDIEPAGARWRLVTEPTSVEPANREDPSDDVWDQVVVTAPARAVAPVLASAAPESSRLLATLDHADVIMVTLAVPAPDWPDRLRGRSGYLVPKPVQRYVTAASFASQKWAHWRPADGSEILRVSLGRDGVPVDHMDDDAALSVVLDELSGHLGTSVTPTEVRVTRWIGAFPQYRPHHDRWVTSVRAGLPAGLHVAGASYDGIGIPACVRSARTTVDGVVAT